MKNWLYLNLMNNSLKTRIIIVYYGGCSTPGAVDYTGGISLNTLGGGGHSTSGYIMSRPGGVQCTGVSIQIQLFFQ